MASYLSKIADFIPPHLHLALAFGVIPSEFYHDFWCQKTIGLRCFNDPKFICFGATDRHRHIVYYCLYVTFCQVALLTANFDPYVNDVWLSRHAVLMHFQQAARKVFSFFFPAIYAASSEHLSTC